MLWYALMLGPILAPAPSVPLGHSEQKAADACQARLVAKMGEISAFSVTTVDNRGRRMVINGILNRDARPPDAAPGMMTPAHIVVEPYRFTCHLRGDRVESVRTFHTP